MSPPRIAVGLLTCNRTELTERTLASFSALHPAGTFHALLHFDDASDTRGNRHLAYDYGFTTVNRSLPERQGQMSGLRALVSAAERAGADWFLFLENDWEWERPFPRWAIGRDTLPVVRLYGAAKAKTGPRAPTGRTNMATGREIVWYRTHDPALEFTDAAHWAGPPSISRMLVMREVVKHASVKAASKALSYPTLRVGENCVWHLGEETTEGFLP